VVESKIQERELGYLGELTVNVLTFTIALSQLG
jgi:K+-transporting ATPase c subunit